MTKPTTRCRSMTGGRVHVQDKQFTTPRPRCGTNAKYTWVDDRAYVTCRLCRRLT